MRRDYCVPCRARGRKRALLSDAVNVLNLAFFGTSGSYAARRTERIIIGASPHEDAFGRKTRTDPGVEANPHELRQGWWFRHDWADRQMPVRRRACCSCSVKAASALPRMPIQRVLVWQRTALSGRERLSAAARDGCRFLLVKPTRSSQI